MTSNDLPHDKLVVSFGQTEFWLNLEGAGSLMDVFTAGIARITTSSAVHAFS